MPVKTVVLVGDHLLRCLHSSPRLNPHRQRTAIIGPMGPRVILHATAVALHGTSCATEQSRISS